MNNDDTMLDIDELTKMVEEKLQELDETKDEVHERSEIDKTIYDFGDLLNRIEAKIKEIEEYENNKIDIDEVTNKVNAKLNYMLEFHDEDEYEKTLYDLEEVSQMINEALDKLEKDHIKKAKKARYCDLARKNARKNNKISRKKEKKQG